VARKVRGSGSVQDDAGAELLRWSFGGPQDGLGISLGASDGRLVPIAGGGAPVDLLVPRRLRLVESATSYVLRSRSASV
jgi:hypothetical protein